MKIFEFNPGIGSFSSGFEKFGPFEVTQVQNISPEEAFAYNIIHKHQFSRNNSQFINEKRLKKHDLAILKPDFGILMTQKRFKDINLDQLWSCLAYLKAHQPKIAIIITPTSVIKSLNMAFGYVTDGFDMVSKDIVIESMQKSGYMAWQLVVNQVQCGVPMYYPVNFYIAVRNDQGNIDEMNTPKIHYGISKGKMPYTTISDALSDLPGEGDDYAYYAHIPKNSYQAWCRQYSKTEITLNRPKNEPDSITKCLSNVKQGVPLSKVDDIKENKGKRAIYNRPADIGYNFHLIKGNGACIHPLYPRAFTLREGARLHGLQDHINFPTHISEKRIAEIIHQSISPLTASYVLGIIKPYIHP